MTAYIRPVRGTFLLKRGDTQPGIEILLPDWVDIAGASAYFMMSDRKSGAQRVAAPCQLATVGVEKVAHYAWGPTDADPPGIYDAEVEIRLSGGEVLTWPDDFYLQVLINGDLGTGGGAGNSPPYFSSAGHITPPTGGIGAVFTLSAPVAGGYPTPTTTLTALTQAGVDVLASVVGSQYTSTAVGALVATWTANNGVSPDATGTASATISITPVAPVLLTAGSIAPSSGAVGTVFTLTKPTASGVPTPTVTLTGLTQNGVDVLGSVVANAFISTESGALVATWTISNSAGTLAPATATATVSAATGAPVITVVGSISPSSGAIGTVFTLTPPTATGTPSPTVSLTTLTQNGVDVLGLVSGGTFTSTGVGTISATWTATNAVSPDATSTATALSNPVVGIAALSRDRAIFDSKAAFGQNTAAVPLSGTGSDGMVVEARALSVDDSGATSTSWASIATISGGVWSGNIDVPRSASWYKPEVRIASVPAVSAQGSNRFGIGHIIAIWGQSEVAHMANTFYSGSSPPSVSDPEAVQVHHWTTGTTPGTGPANMNRRFISNATPITAALASMAATLIASRPGEKFSVILHAIPGTDFRQMVNDGDINRYWSDDLALHNFAVTDGAKVGMAGMSWFAAPGNLGANYGDVAFPIIAGKTLAGVTQTVPGTIVSGAGNFPIDHFMGELYDYNFTKWVAYGPHRFDVVADLQDATHLAGGAVFVGGQNKQDARDSWRATQANVNATMFLPMGISPMSYENGRDNGPGLWTDETHPGPTADGSPLWARLTILSFLKAGGLVSWAAPKFDNCLWESTGAYVEVWSSAGSITTTRLARSDTPLPATYPHWTEVFGFQINGAPAQSATIVAGRVRLTKNGGGNFIFSDVVTFGDGGATGQVKYPEDMTNKTWKNYPIVNVGAPGVDGIPVDPRPAPAALANTLPSTPQFTTVAGQSTRFTDTANWPTSGGQMTLAVDMAFGALAAQSYIAEMSNLHVTLSAATNGQLFLAIKDSSATSILSSTLLGTITIGTRFSLIVAIDLVALTAWTTLNGTTTARTLAANTGNLASASRKMGFLARASGTTGNCIGTIYQLEIWTECVSGGGKPPTDTNLRANGRIVGPAATANAHAWKAGGNVV